MVFNHLQKSLKTYVPLSSSRGNSGVWGVTSGERVWHEQAVWTNVWKEPQDSSGCLGTVASAEKGFEWPWDAWARFDEHDFFLDSSLSSRWPWANYVFHHRQGGLPLCLLLFQKQNMPWAPKTYMFIEVFMGYIYNLVFQVAFRSNPLFLSMGFLEVFSMGFSAAPSQLQTAGWYDIVGSDFQQGTNSVHLPHGEGGGSSRRRRPSFRWGFVGCFHGEVVQLQMWRSVDVCETQPAFFKGGKDGGIRGVKVFVYDVCAQIFHEDGTSIRSGNMNQTTLKHVQVASLLLLLFVVMTTVKCVMHTSMNNMRP